MKNEKEIIDNEQLVRLAFSKNIKVHLTLTNNSWRNGNIIAVYPDFFLFKDIENLEEPFFYMQVRTIEPYLNLKKEKDGI